MASFADPVNTPHCKDEDINKMVYEAMKEALIKEGEKWVK